MAWNPEPSIAALREFARKFDRPVVVTFSIDRDGERFYIDTFGETKSLCRLAGSFGDKIASAVASGQIAAPEIGPVPTPAASVWRRERPIGEVGG